jgi:hypothetical protein
MPSARAKGVGREQIGFRGNMITCWPLIRKALLPIVKRRRVHRTVYHKLKASHAPKVVKAVCAVTTIGAVGTSSLPIPSSAISPPGLIASAPGVISHPVAVYPLLELPISYVLAGWESDLNGSGDVYLGPIEPGTGPQPVDEPTAVALLLPALICLTLMRLSIRRA